MGFFRFGLLTISLLLPCLVISSTQEEIVWRVLVPNRTSFTEFVDCSNHPIVTGFSIDVFETALHSINPNITSINYTCYNLVSNAQSQPAYDALVNNLASSNGSYNLAVGDITIGANRSREVAFTQPYVESGMVILSPATGLPSHAWAVFLPFTPAVWKALVGCFLLVGFALWVLERSNHPEFGQGRPQERFERISWFVASILILLKHELVQHRLSKLLMIAWILFMILVGASYTASFASLLTSDKLFADIQSINTLKKDKLQIGYPNGSIAFDFLTGPKFNIPERQLTALSGPDEYKSALSNKSVAAVVDEIPYVSLFLASLSSSDCKFVVVQPKLTTEGFGLAFPKDSPWTAKFTEAILNLSEAGELGQLQEKANLTNFECAAQVQAGQVDWQSSKWLFLFLGIVCVSCLGLKLFGDIKDIITHSRRCLGRSDSRRSIAEMSNFESARSELSIEF